MHFGVKMLVCRNESVTPGVVGVGVGVGVGGNGVFVGVGVGGGGVAVGGGATGVLVGVGVAGGGATGVLVGVGVAGGGATGVLVGVGVAGGGATGVLVGVGVAAGGVTGVLVGVGVGSGGVDVGVGVCDGGLVETLTFSRSGVGSTSPLESVAVNVTVNSPASRYWCGAGTSSSDFPSSPKFHFTLTMSPSGSVAWPAKLTVAPTWIATSPGGVMIVPFGG